MEVFSLKYCFLLLGSLLNAEYSFDDSGYFPYTSVPIDWVRYRSTLAKPFGEVIVSIEFKGQEEVESIAVQVAGVEMLVDSEFVAGIEDLSPPYFSFSKPGAEPQKKRIDYFQILFEFGDEYTQRLRSDILDCEREQCFLTHRPILRLVIDSEFSMTADIVIHEDHE
ncbi:MAG: hypothetical protein ACXIUB_01750 [Wenzhouxiangella sp.]